MQRALTVFLCGMVLVNAAMAIQVLRTVVVLGAVVMFPAQNAVAATRIVEIIADKNNTFKVVGSKKPVINATPGEVLKLKITAHKSQEADADGAVHSFTIKELKDQNPECWDIRLYEGTVTVTCVTPEEPGEYVFECTVKCGEGHEDMRGKLIVKEKKK